MAEWLFILQTGCERLLRARRRAGLGDTGGLLPSSPSQSAGETDRRAQPGAASDVRLRGRSSIPWRARGRQKVRLQLRLERALNKAQV